MNVTVYKIEAVLRVGMRKLVQGRYEVIGPPSHVSPNMVGGGNGPALAGSPFIFWTFFRLAPLCTPTEQDGSMESWTNSANTLHI